jgi:predicted nucleic acid-binding Zn ribbon protein
MPLYNFKCFNINCELYNTDKLICVSNKDNELICEKCGEALHRVFPTSTHIVSVGGSKDGKDIGKVNKEKNDSLKKKWSGYSYEEQNLRNKVTQMADKVIQNRK